MFSIEAIMSTNLITVAPDATLAEARSLMHENRIHHIPVIDGDLLCSCNRINRQLCDLGECFRL